MKLLILSIDAMFSEQAARLQTRPALAPFFRHCLTALNMRAVYPALTYPCHASILSGNPPSVHGIYQNVACVPNAREKAWNWDYGLLRCRTLMDAFRGAGWRSASIMWPVSANAPVDYLVPEIWSYTEDPVQVMTASSNGKAGHIIARHREDVDFSSKWKLDRFAKDCAIDIAEEFDPDVMFLHFSLVDHARHRYGIRHARVEKAFDQCAAWLEEILSHISGEGLTLAVLGDHGHLNCRGKISLNGLFVRQGWAPDPLPGSMAQCRAFCHGAGVSAQVYVNDSALRPELETLFEALREQGYLWNWYTREAVRQYGLDGPFDYVLEGGEEYFFTDEILPQFLTLTPAADGGCFVGKHGHFPLRGERPPFLLSSPGIESRTLSDHSILDIAPTLTELFHLPAFPMAGSSLLRL